MTTLCLCVWEGGVSDKEIKRIKIIIIIIIMTRRIVYLNIYSYLYLFSKRSCNLSLVVSCSLCCPR